jgi:hypothetical protein
MVLVSGPSVSHLHSPFTSPCRTFSPCLRTRRTTRPQRCLRPQPRPPDGPRTAPCVDPVLKERPTASSSRRRVTAVGGASARSRCWVQRIQIRAFTHSGAFVQCTALTPPGFMSRFVIYKVHLLCSGLNNGDGRPSAPLTDILYRTSTRRASSRYAGETGTRKPPQQRMREKWLCAAPAHVHPAHAAFLLP